MKKTLFAFFVLGLCVLSIAFLHGCASSPTSGGGSSSDVAPNTGTISGYVYVCDHGGGTYTGTPEVIISVSTEAMSLEVVTTTDASGKYTLSGLSSGLITVTATGAGYDPQTIVANSSTINFVIKNLGIGLAGTATIRGTIEGVAGGTSVSLKAYPFSQKHFNSSTYFFDLTTLTYEVTGAPDDGDTYIRAYYTDGGGNLHFAYNKITTSSGGTFYMNISFEAGVTIDATIISVPSGYTASNIWASVSKNNRKIVRVSDNLDISGTSCQLNGIAPLKSGDSYIVTIVATDAADDGYIKDYFGRSTGNQTFIDNSSMPSPFMVNPPSCNFTTIPTSLEWNSVSGADYYVLDVYGTSFAWHIYTADTKIKIPPSIVSLMPAGGKNLDIVARHYVTSPPQIYNLNAISPDNYYDYSLLYGF